MAAIAFWIITRQVPVLEAQITSNAQTALDSANARDISLSISGRTATLSGSVKNDVQKQQLINVVNGADGVRQVNDQLVIAGQTANAPNTDDSSTTDNEPKVADASNSEDAPVTDNAPKDAYSTVTDDSTETAAVKPDDNEVAPKQVINEADEIARNPEEPANTTVDKPVVEADVTNTKLANVQETSEITESPEVAQTPEIPELDANAVQALADEKQALIDARVLAILAQARKETGNSLIDPETPRPAKAQKPATSDAPIEQPQVAITEMPGLRMKVSEGTLTLSGDISNKDDLLPFISVAMSTFKANYVVNTVQTHANTATALWLPALNAFLPDMNSIANASISVTESQIMIEGEAANNEEHDQLINIALTKLSELSLVERISVARNVPTQPDSDTESPQVIVESNEVATEKLAPKNQLQNLQTAFDAIDSDKILFESGSNVLTEDSLRVIEAMATLFAEYPSASIEINGHTDASGVSAKNLQLSQLRANAVRDYLVELGIADKRMTAYGFGDGVPVADNSTAAGRRLNRRIEFNF